MTSRYITAVVALALLGIGFSFPGSGRSPAQERAKDPSRVKWEYKVVAIGGGGLLGAIDEKTLLGLGEEGWELTTVSDGQPYVSSSTTRYTFGPGKPDNTSTTNTINYTRTVYYFKRPK